MNQNEERDAALAAVFRQAAEQHVAALEGTQATAGGSQYAQTENTINPPADAAKMSEAERKVREVLVDDYNFMADLLDDRLSY